MSSSSHSAPPQKNVPWKRILLTVAVVIVVLALAGGYRAATSHGLFTKVPAASTAQCAAIPGVPGVNDIVIDAADGIAFLAVTDQRAHRAGKPVTTDGIYAYAYKKAGAKPVKLAGTSKDFHPHALAMSRDANGGMMLLAVNYGPNRTRSVISFSVSFVDGTPGLSEQAIAMSGLLVSPHGIATVGNGYYYVTNDHRVKSDAGRWVDDHFVLPRSDILYFNGTSYAIAAQGINFPAGIAASRDGNYVYVAERYARKLVTFKRDPFRGILKQVAVMKLPANPSRMTMAADGSLWLAATPKPYAAAAFKKDAAQKAPSMVWHVSMNAGLPQTLDLVFADDGHRLSDAAVAAEAAGKLLIGSGFEGKLAVCAQP